jgi:hypothetical protein
MVISIALGVTLLTVTERNEPIYDEDNYLSICWIKRFKAHSNDTSPYFWSLFAVPLAGVYLVAIAAVVVARKRLLSGLPETVNQSVVVFVNSIRMVMSFLLYWSIVAVAFGVTYYADDRDPPRYMQYVLAVLVGGKGIVNLVAWILTHDIEEVSHCRAG